MKVFVHSSTPPKASAVRMCGKECRRVGDAVEKWMRELQKPGPKGRGGDEMAMGEEVRIRLAMESLQQSLKSQATCP